MSNPPTEELDEALREVDELWEAERQDPELRWRRLRREFARSVLRLWASFAALMAGGALLVEVLNGGWWRTAPAWTVTFSSFVYTAVFLVIVGVTGLVWTRARYVYYLESVRGTRPGPNPSEAHAGPTGRQ